MDQRPAELPRMDRLPAARMPRMAELRTEQPEAHMDRLQAARMDLLQAARTQSLLHTSPAADPTRRPAI